MTLGQAFPRTAAAYPEVIRWDARFDWESDAVRAVAAINKYQIQIQSEGDEALFRLSELVRADLIDQTAQAPDARAAAMMDGVRFVVAQPPIARTMANGQLGDCYGWTLWAISRDHDPETRVNTAEYRLPPFAGASTEMNENALSFAVDWVAQAFMLARKFGGLDNICSMFFDSCLGISFHSLARGETENGLQALVAMVNWASGVGHPKGESLTRRLLEFYRSGSLDPRQRVIVGMAFVTEAGYWTDQDPRTWAEELLSQTQDYLVEHETLQLLSVVAATSIESWTKHRANVLLEASALADRYRALVPGGAGRAALDSRVSILHPLIYGLSKFGITEDIVDLLWAWYGRTDREKADSNILFVSPNHGDGAAFVWPGGRWFAVNAGGPESIEALVVAYSNALNEYIRGPAGDRVPDIDERLAGTPAREHGATLAARMEEHYQLAALADRLPEGFRPRATVVMPPPRGPLQAMLADAVGWIAPLDVTLAKPADRREIRTIGIWPGLTYFTDAEVEMLEALGDREGCRIKKHGGPLDEASFKQFYEDPELDVIWIIGHGEHSPFRQGETGLVLLDDTVMPLPRMAEFEVPRHNRRLLVLNVCSSGATQDSGGIARIGIGQELTSPYQQVVGHLWPIDLYAALAFGCAFACSLFTTSKPEDALADCIRLMRDHEALIAEISSVSPDLSAIARLGGEQVGGQLKSVLSWGCPVLLT